MKNQMAVFLPWQPTQDSPIKGLKRAGRVQVWIMLLCFLHVPGMVTAAETVFNIGLSVLHEQFNNLHEALNYCCISKACWSKFQRAPKKVQIKQSLN